MMPAYPARLSAELPSPAAANLGRKASIALRTLVSLLATGGHGISARHILVLDEAGQLGNRQGLRVLEISRATGARLIFLGDNKQTGAIEQGKAYWLLQQLGLPTSQLQPALRQKTDYTQDAAALPPQGDSADSLAAPARVPPGTTP